MRWGIQIMANRINRVENHDFWKSDKVIGFAVKM